MSDTALSASILLLCYRDAPYIRAALESALAQSVPCEIIVSNDCSDDGTFELAQEMVANYRGPHRVSVRRNEHNLGVAAHVNATVPLTHGDIVVMKKQSEAKNGDMVAARLIDRDEMTLKYFYLEPNRVRLQPANPTLGPIYTHPTNIEIQGRVVAVIRRVH